jgi:hypothetical protein
MPGHEVFLEKNPGFWNLSQGSFQAILTTIPDSVPVIRYSGQFL